MIDKIFEFIEQNYQNPEMSTSYAAEHFHLSNRQFRTFFYEYTGQNFWTYIEHKRLFLSEQYLLKTDLKIADIARLTGYNTIDSYYKAFRKYHNTTPGKWRQEHHYLMEK